jgi:hypothetical protein
MSRLAQILALAARLSEADAHRWPLAFYVREARAIVLTEIEA